MKEKCDDKRNARRYRGNALNRVEAVVQTTDGKSYDGRLDDVSVAGAAIRLAANEAPHFKIGQVMTITLRVPLPGHGYQIIDIPAEIRNMTPEDESGTVRCGLEFDHRVQAGSAFYSALRTLANRRNEPRVAPACGEEITIVLKTADGEEVEGSVQDISAHGARVMIGSEFAKDSIGFDNIALSFQLPSEDHETSATGIIRNHRIDQDETVVGIQFDDVDSPDFTAHQRDIIRYLMQRQRDLLRKT